MVPITITLPMPTIVVQLPAIMMMTPPPEADRGQHNGLNSTCVICGYP